MNKIAIVTGAGAGVGRAVTLTLAKEGKTVIAVGRSVDNTTETARLASEFSEVVPVIADIGVEDDVIRYVNFAVEKYGRIDILANCAARFQPAMLLADVDNELFDDVFRINVKGSFWSMKYSIQQMLKQDGGVIVNVSSVDGLFTDPSHSIYVASKHALMGMVKSVAREYGSQGIRCCAVCPGMINTKMVAGFLETFDHNRLGPMKRAAEAQEIADAVCFLCSDKATYLNGTVIQADGGMRI